MHLHGHFFRVVNGQGDRAPLKHTVDVAPMSTTVIEFAADELGDWLFHCHLLYHMESGMARVMRYEGHAPGPELAGQGAMAHEDHWHGFATIDVLSSMTTGELRLADTRDELSLLWEAGWGGGDAAWETLAAYGRAVNAFFSPFAGIEAAGADGAATEARGVLGVRYLLPLVIEVAVRADTRGELRVTLEKELPLLPRLQARGEIEYDTGEGWEGKAGLSYTLGRDLSLLAEWHSEFGWGAGMQLRH
jgi:hypothetical protein